MKFDLTSQYINLFFKCFNIKTKLIIKNLFFICHVIIFFDKIKFNFAFFINFINCVVATCCVGRAESHYMKWCRLKFLKICVSHSFSIAFQLMTAWINCSLTHIIQMMDYIYCVCASFWFHFLIIDWHAACKYQLMKIPFFISTTQCFHWYKNKFWYHFSICITN